MTHGEISRIKIINRIWIEITIKIAIKKGESVGLINRKVNAKDSVNVGNGMETATGIGLNVRQPEIAGNTGDMESPAVTVTNGKTGDRKTGAVVTDGKTGIRTDVIGGEKKESITGENVIPEIIEQASVHMKGPGIRIAEKDVRSGQMTTELTITGGKTGITTVQREPEVKKDRSVIITVKDGQTGISQNRIADALAGIGTTKIVITSENSSGTTEENRGT